MLQPLHNSILFVFLDKIGKNRYFKESTDWGFEIHGDHQTSSKFARWAKVLAVGPEVNTDDIKVGEYICIEPLMWTEGFTHDDIEIWRTSADKILITSENLPVL